MSLPAVLEALGVPLDTARVVKLGPRKSAAQPTTWAILPADGSPLFVKLAPAHLRDAGERIEREAILLDQMGELPPSDPIRERIPTLRHEGSTGGWRWLALDLVLAPPAEVRVRRLLRRSSADLLPWLAERLAWLRLLQTHEHLRRRLDLAEDEVLVHGDYSHYNFLENRERVVVVDWEDWRVDRRPWLDALHCTVLPVLGAGSVEEAVRGLEMQLLREGAYARGARALLEPFLRGIGFETALADHLRFQEALCATRAPELAERFRACLRTLHGTAS
jgi:hypothetical protein